MSVHKLITVRHYTVSKKTAQNYFCQDFVKFPPSVKIFGTKMAKTINLYEMHSFSTLTNLYQRTTVLNTDVLNCYITL